MKPINNKSMNFNKILKNTIIYFLLSTGFLLVYVIDIEGYIYENKKKGEESKSKVNFIYQQF